MTADPHADRSVVPGIDRPARVATAQANQPISSIAMRIGFGAVLVGFTVLFVYPFIWMLSASLKDGAEVFNNEVIPNPIKWENYPTLFELTRMGDWTRNSVIVSVLAAVTVTFSSALVAFAFAYFRFPYRGLLFGVVLASMMLPGAVTMIPTFLIWDWLGWTNTLVPLWAGNLFASPFYIFLLRQFFLTVSREIEEAAIVDGANPMQVFFHVMLPLVKPVLLAVGVLSFQGNWNNFRSALIYLNSPTERFTLPLGLQFFQAQLTGGEAPRWHYMMAMSTLMALPIIVLFFLAQRQFIEGIQLGGVKG